jgi:predicted transcriptional regulator
MARPKKDFLEELVEEWTAKNPRFPELLAEAEARRVLAKRLVAARIQRGLSQTTVAAAMRTAQSVVSKLEAGSDVKLSTMQRYCEVIGQNLVISIGPRKPTKRAATARARSTSKAKARR